jgi:bifunctional UDP-N-acetylglucosamine pyrophosphorylase / glucosamine-1-phosphate N-acetyltransferase
MESQTAKVGVVILAAGHGNRMKSDIPKVMHELHGKPLVDHVVSHVEESGCCVKPVVIVSPDRPIVAAHLGDRCEYAMQEKQLGTGHATAQAEELLKGKVDHVIVLYGDMPFLSAESLQRLVTRHEERNNTITLMTFTVPHFENDFAPFKGFSRVVRNAETGHIARDVQMKDATAEELEIKELNPCYFCFNSDWLWENLKKVGNNNAQDEFYLTDLLQMAIRQGEKISSIDIPPNEARGINTQDDLAVAKSINT